MKNIIVILFALILPSTSFSAEDCELVPALGQLIKVESGKTIKSFGEGRVYICSKNGNRIGFLFSDKRSKPIFGAKKFPTAWGVVIGGETYSATENDYFVQDAALCVTRDHRKTAYCAMPYVGEPNVKSSNIKSSKKRSLRKEEVCLLLQSDIVAAMLVRESGQSPQEAYKIISKNKKINPELTLHLSDKQTKALINNVFFGEMRNISSKEIGMNFIESCMRKNHKPL